MTDLFHYTRAPYGACPVQAQGVLATGESFYFRYRGASAKLYIYSTQNIDLSSAADELACYATSIDGDGMTMPDEQVQALIEQGVVRFQEFRAAALHLVQRITIADPKSALSCR